MKTPSNGWTPDQVLGVLNDRLISLEGEVRRELAGFPELFATKLEIDLLRANLEAIRGDHVARRELEEVKTANARISEHVQSKLDEQTGRRSGTAVASAIIATILAVMFGFIWQAQITRAEVSDQIAREAPWNSDKNAVERRITALEVQNTAQRIQILQIQAQIRFFCATRTKAGLPGC